MSAARTLHLTFSVCLIALAATGCSDSETGGGGDGGGTVTTAGTGGEGGGTITTAAGQGGEGGDAPTSVLGTSQDGTCSTADDFADACEAEGGLLADSCQSTECGGPGWRANCYEPPPAPGPQEFSCDGLFNCAVGEVCRVVSPAGDGCYGHACEPLPAACVDDPSCDCVLAEIGADLDTCEVDGDGNPTVQATE